MREKKNLNNKNRDLKVKTDYIILKTILKYI